jgi:hypothetical protein
MASPDPHGQVALMLCESLMHLLVESGLIANDKALEAIAGLAELTREIAERNKTSDDARSPARARRGGSPSAEDLVQELLQSFTAKDEEESRTRAERGRSPRNRRPRKPQP